jgi:hypothetical protein
VPERSSGRVWSVKVKAISPTLYLLGVPPFVATSPDRLLVPRETKRP